MSDSSDAGERVFVGCVVALVQFGILLLLLTWVKGTASDVAAEQRACIAAGKDVRTLSDLSVECVAR